MQQEKQQAVPDISELQQHLTKLTQSTEKRHTRVETAIYQVSPSWTLFAQHPPSTHCGMGS